MAGEENARPAPPSAAEAREAVLGFARSSPVELDFLITAFVAAASCSRRSSVCAPFPLDLFHLDGVQGVGGRWEKDFESVERCMRLLRPVRELADPAVLSQLPERVVLLLHWLVDGRRQRGLRAVGSGDMDRVLADCGCAGASRDPTLRPDWVLQMCHDEEGAAGDCHTGFHGTYAENIHSITRVGIVNASGTHLQRVGAAFGNGIYLSTDLGVAYSFSVGGKGWEHSALGTKLQFLFVCEVDKEAVPEGLPETYMVVERCDRVRLKNIFIYRVPEESPATGQVGWGGWKVDRCTLLIVLYAVMLGLLGMSQSRYRTSDLWDMLGVEWDDLV